MFRSLLHRFWHVPRAVKTVCLVIMGLSLCLFVLRLSSVPSSYVNYGVYPIATIALAIGVTMTARQYPKLIFRNAEDKEYLVAGMTLLWGVGYFLLGLIFTYTRNPLVVSPLSVILNIWAYIVPVVAIEFARFSTLRILGRTRLWFGAVIVAAFSLLQISQLPIMTDTSIEEVIPRLVSVVMPIILYNAVATYLCIFAGLKSAILFHAGVYAILTALPIMPKLDWYLIGMGALVVSMMVYFTVGSMRQDRRLSFRGKVASKEGVIANILGGVFLVFFVLFMANVFYYQPLAIMSNSMHPTYSRGDMVIVRSIKDTSNIKIGDIIKYQKDATTITHRVVAIKHSEGGRGRVYTTKGDNNLSADSWPVTSSMISGVVMAKVPLVGYPSIWLYEIMHPSKARVEGVINGA